MQELGNCHACNAKVTTVGLYLCNVCVARYKDTLGDFDHIESELHRAIHKQTVTSSPGIRVSTSQTYAPGVMNEGAYVALHGLNNLLSTVVRSIIEDEDTHQVAWLYKSDGTHLLDLHGNNAYVMAKLQEPNGSIADSAQWLVEHAEIMASLDTAADNYTLVVKEIAKARRYVQASEERVTYGICGTPVEGYAGIVCGYSLTAVKGAQKITCRACGMEWTLEERWRETMRKAPESILTTVNIAKAFLLKGIRGVTPMRIANWNKNGCLSPAGTVTRLSYDGSKEIVSNTYRLADVLDVWMTLQEKKASVAERKRTKELKKTAIEASDALHEENAA